LSYAQIIALHAETALREGIIDRIIDNDFPTLGKAYAALSDDDYRPAARSLGSATARSTGSAATPRTGTRCAHRHVSRNGRGDLRK
jgi:hypothetical protein